MIRRYRVRVPLVGGRAIEKNALNHSPNHTGGVLMGWWESPTLVNVEVLIGPGPGALHETTRFIPDHEWQRKEMARLYEVSHRRLRYLGDWHVHPGDVATPSHQDLTTARLIRDHDPARVERPVMLIATGGADGKLEPIPYVLRLGKLVTARLEWSKAPVITWF